MKKLIVLLVISLVFAIPFVSFAGSVELSPAAKPGVITIEFNGDAWFSGTTVQKKLEEKKLMFFPIPRDKRGDAMGGAIWIGTKFAGFFHFKDNNLVGDRGAIGYNYGDANTLYETYAYDVITFYAGEMGMAIKLYSK